MTKAEIVKALRYKVEQLSTSCDVWEMGFHTGLDTAADFIEANLESCEMPCCRCVAEEMTND